MSDDPPKSSLPPTSAEDRHRQVEATKIESALQEIRDTLHHHLDVKGPAVSWERFWRRAEVCGLWAAAIVGLVAIAWSSQDAAEQRNVMSQQIEAMRLQTTLANRAWVNVPGIAVDIYPNNLVWHLWMQNTGHTPAFGMNYAETFWTVPDPPTMPDDYGDLFKPEGDACKDLKPKDGGIIFSPLSKPDIEDSGTATPVDLKEFRELTAGKRFFALSGCVAYTTFNQIHHTGFCTYIRPDPKQPPDRWITGNCNTGNYED